MVLAVNRYHGHVNYVEQITISVPGSGLHECTDRVSDVVSASGASAGLCTVFIRHTSASLIIQENADPSARVDMEAWLDRLVPEGDSLYTHVDEGPDDMPAHIKAALLPVSLTIPVTDGQLALGTWQGIYLFEHRAAPHRRQIVAHLGG